LKEFTVALPAFNLMFTLAQEAGFSYFLPTFAGVFAAFKL
jgi:hypothetical protein